MEELHPELKEIIENAARELDSESQEACVDDFKRIEKTLFEDQGDPDFQHQLYAMRAIAKDTELEIADGVEVKDFRQDKDSKTFIAVELIGEGNDIYGGLSNMRLAMSLADDETCVGTIVRCGGYIKDKDNKERIGESVVTIMYASKYICSAVRTKGTDEVVYNTITIDDWEMGESKLIDAIVMMTVMPRYLREKRPRLYNALKLELEETDDE
jgi:hypothetical protein